MLDGATATAPDAEDGLTGESAGEVGLDLEPDGDLVADDHTAPRNWDGEVDAEVAAVDFGSGSEPGHCTALAVGADAVQFASQLDRPGDTVQRQVPVDGEPVADHPDRGRAVDHRGVARHIEVVGRAEVVVAVGVAGVDRLHVDLYCDC